ncbi:prephenate dehydrogenase [Arthrobacter sp. zg-Y916]|uniref:Prephenate dehydrogenase n=1 Tax=Arthrobacter caoxuetaonis TaxID=2886935 RepID=A0A9X1MFK8_9MICC|nr:prephenate dehydrogenase [Arthrobacter caoxuetaonis]MCC3299208.1 prephenate dehydrogenase [Arthrobacter caoxuetaonis]MCC9193088.1 prephenate dehydrogenase [Arthrobacter sp. zg-Y916]USQ58468.1 prephenate dehydrogenase [Arthrobacter caoxuetaonis]
MTVLANGGTHLSGPVLVIGTGLLGASIGLGLRARGIDVALSDISPSTEAVARDIGAGRRLAEAEAGFAPQLVVVAAPPDVTASLVAQALEDWPSAVVVDIASVKAAVLADLQESGADLSRYVGTHPMAGREKSGPVAALGDLFMSMPWVICAGEHSSPDAVKVAEALAIDLGAVVSRMSAEDHDQSVALISHLPQVMSSLVASRLQETPPAALALAGNGLRDVTRIAASDPKLWVQILSGNAPRLVNILHGVREDLNRLINTLENPTADGARLDMAQLISEGNTGQARIPGKHGTPPQSFVSFTVLVDDTPGQIARLLTEIGEIGVNLEDLRLEHASGREVGRAEISVLPSKMHGLVSALTARGWKVVE